MITMTSSAIAHARKMLDNRGKGLGIRVGLKRTGCSGMAYKLEFADAVSPQDHMVDLGEVVLLVSAADAPALEGMEMDYVKEGLSEGFKFNNPNVKSQCGCGESFQV